MNVRCHGCQTGALYSSFGHTYVLYVNFMAHTFTEFLSFSFFRQCWFLCLFLVCQKDIQCCEMKVSHHSVIARCDHRGQSSFTI